jgi:probable H4MPT-linked C1 transfer pathway protein
MDVGGANIKVALGTGEAWEYPFPLWKQPDNLAAKLAEILVGFSQVDRLAVTMTGELCDCYTTKSEGVSRIIDAVLATAGTRETRFWTTDQGFVPAETARANTMTIAAANWHALAFALGRMLPSERLILVDIGSTTTDIIPILQGKVCTVGRTDPARLLSKELIYTGVKRTPVCALLPPGEGAAELFATTWDVHLLLGHSEEQPKDTDTADGRPATRVFAHARMSRILGGDPMIIPKAETLKLAERVYETQQQIIQRGIQQQLGRLSPEPVRMIVSGSGEFLARAAVAELVKSASQYTVQSLRDYWPPAAVHCAPAYACAVLAEAGGS